VRPIEDCLASTCQHNCTEDALQEPPFEGGMPINSRCETFAQGQTCIGFVLWCDPLTNEREASFSAPYDCCREEPDTCLDCPPEVPVPECIARACGHDCMADALGSAEGWIPIDARCVPEDMGPASCGALLFICNPLDSNPATKRDFREVEFQCPTCGPEVTPQDDCLATDCNYDCMDAAVAQVPDGWRIAGVSCTPGTDRCSATLDVCNPTDGTHDPKTAAFVCESCGPDQEPPACVADACGHDCRAAALAKIPEEVRARTRLAGGGCFAEPPTRPYTRCRGFVFVCDPETNEIETYVDIHDCRDDPCFRDPICCEDPCCGDPDCGGDPCGGDPCCGDPCCGDPCCGDPCCGDPCCGDPCCGDPCCGDPCCGDPCCGDPCCGAPWEPGCPFGTCESDSECQQLGGGNEWFCDQNSGWCCKIEDLDIFCAFLH
jgi:hypothetical protein